MVSLDLVNTLRELVLDKKKPIMGICLGMQSAVIEFSRNVLNLKDADSTEMNVTNTGTLSME